MENSTARKKSSWPWRILRWGLIGLAGLITLVALLWAEENWRGKREWEKYKREWEAKGERFDLKAFVPPPVPDEQNFAMTPFFAPLFDFNPKPLLKGQSYWRDTNAVQKVRDFGNDMGYPKASASWERAKRIDLTAWSSALDGKKDAPPSGESSSERAASAEAVLRKLEKYNPVLEELQAASHRPYCRFNIGYSEDDPTQILLPHLAILKKFSLIYRLRASAEAAAGRNEAALEDIRMCLYLGDCVKSEPVLISSLVRIAIIKIALQPVWEGLADHRFSDAQLKDLQQELIQLDMLKAYEETMRGERAFNITGLNYFRRSGRYMVAAGDYYQINEERLPLTPGAVYYQNEVAMGRMYEKIILPPVDVEKHRVYLELSTNQSARLDEEMKDGFNGYTIFAKLLFPAISHAEQKFANVQANVDEAVIACALERYRLAHGQFPEALDALSPQFIEKVPMDLITGEPLKYRRTTDGRFILYSVGWNGTDDGGTVVMGKGRTPTVDVMQGDWVWEYPKL